MPTVHLEHCGSLCYPFDEGVTETSATFQMGHFTPELGCAYNYILNQGHNSVSIVTQYVWSWMSNTY